MTCIAMEEYDLMKDSKYRMYVAAVDKALKNFEYTAEWADLIAALGKLNKVLSSYQKYQIIPRRIKISKRLAQCMHPALPSGVHLKALETYDVIFKCMGTNRLSQELFIYSSGLFPLLGHAAMNIRPPLLTVYETHFVPLRERLRPALSGFLSGVLPGLETGSDHFERTNLLLENVCEGVGVAWFYTCMWQCVRSNSPVRLPAISYVLAHYSRKVSMEDQLYLMGNDIDVMVSGLCAAVQDSSVLVQRSALDLLMVCFPMQNTQLLYADMVRLVTAALTTILRRDMSLNRRLYSWLLNVEVNQGQVDQSLEDETEVEPGSPTIAYDLLTEAIRVILKQSSSDTLLDIKPYRLLTSLFDKPQIGPVILDNILYDVFRALYLTCLNQQKHRNSTVRCVSFNGDLTSLKTNENILTKSFLTKYCQELIKNANLLFNTLQSYYIWSYIERLYEKSLENNRASHRDRYQVNDIGSGEPSLLEICILTEFLLDIIPIEAYVENTLEILPNLFKKIVSLLKKHIGVLNKLEITNSLKLCTKILMKIQPITIKHTPKLDLEVSIEDSKSEVNLEDEEKDEVDDTIELRIGLEKSKSDSRINEKASKNELSIDDASRERSNSNQMLKTKGKGKDSPKIDKKTKSKKSKSSSKLYDLKKEETEIEISTPEKKDLKPEAITEGTAPQDAMKVENKHIVCCLKNYKQFYIVFIQSKIIPDVNVEKFFKSLKRDKEIRTKQLENMLQTCLKRDEAVAISRPNELQPGIEASTPSVDADLPEFDEAMSVASNLLVEFAAFPNILNEDVEKEFPLWLKVLIACACYSNVSSEVKIISMNTLLEIFSLAKSQGYELKRNNNNVVVMGILESLHVSLVEESTVVLEVMCQILWDLLGVLCNQAQIVLCVTLLYNIHNVFDSKQFVEQVIGKYLIDDNLCTEHFKRFFLLWHLGRDLNIKLPCNRNVRNFDRCLLKIFDNLQNHEHCNIRLLSETFITHSLLRHDISRIINPILTKLLAPSTARISIRYVNIQDGDSPSDSNSQDVLRLEEANAKKIYAISSVNGNVMFHVTDGPSPKPPKKRWFLFSKTGKKYTQVVNMTASITENLNIVTRKNKDFKTDVSPCMDRSHKGNVKLFVNPLSSKEIYPNGAEGCYTKIDPNNSQRSSSESLSDSSLGNKYEPSSLGTGADSGFDSHTSDRTNLDGLLARADSKRTFLEHIEPISDGIKDHEKPKLPKSHSFDEKSSVPDMENLSLVHSWSYCISDGDNLNAELEISTSAEEFFGATDHEIVSEILSDILDKVCGEKSPVKPRLNEAKNFTLYPMHYHMCLYYEVFDSSLVLYSLRTLSNCLNSNPLLFIRCLATSGLKDMRSNDLLYLIGRHRKSILGTGFSGEIGQDLANFYRGYTFLDLLITICLNFARSFYPSLDDPKLTKSEIDNNLQIQLSSLEILEIIVKHLINIVNDNSKGFSGYIADMLLKCNLQKILLHCLLTSVRNFDEDMTFAEEVLLFNNFKLYDANKRVSEHVEAYQIQLLRLIHSLIILEYKVFPVQKESVPTSVQQIGVATPGEHLTYAPTILIPQQNMFLSAIMSALRHQNMKILHQNWCNMVTSCLPYFGDNLKQISLSVIHQICNNIEKIADAYRARDLGGELSTDYATTQLESLTVLVHYCLLDSTQNANQSPPAGNTVTNPSEIFNNLVNAFFSPIGGEINLSNKQNHDNYRNARKAILSHMPRIISSVAKLWQTIVNIEGDYDGVFGHSKVVKQQLLEFLSPISIHHSASFLAAVAVAWYERRNPFTNVKTVLPEPNASQSNLVYLISAIRVIPLDNLVQTVTAVIKNPPPTEGLSSDICLDVSVLELFYCYMRNSSATQLSEAWTSLLTLIREGCALSPPAQFLLAALLHELMIKCCPLEERKDQKDLQDVTAKLIECVSQVCGSCLEQTTWLRRNLAVKEQDEDVISSVSVVSGSNSDILMGINNNCSVQAQLVLSEILAPILDICFGSVEKDKVNTILTSLMCNIVPYLRTHTVRNMPSFNACSKLLSSLSSYQYTRKAWKKDVFDLLLDNTLFQMDYSCLKYWKVIVDNLMTHDNTTFRDLMSRVSMTQTGSLNIFSSREQEYEQRAQLLKRLAFVIFCSETDQYAKYMPDIQEQLTASLRLSVPGVQAQVFMCFRVLLIRMSPMQVTSLWPIIISEMLQVFIQIEQELSTETEEFSSHIRLLAALDASWAMNSNNGLHALGHPHWLRLQLAAAKLLDLSLLLPATSLPQFQMYRWAFVGDDMVHAPTNSVPHAETPSFTPHVCRIAALMDQKFPDTQIETLPTKQNELLLTMNLINRLQDLHGFFKTLSLCSNRHRTECNGSVGNEYLMQDRQTDRKMQAILEKLDKIVEMDFLDKIPR